MAGKVSAAVIVSCWITIAVLSALYLWIGGVNFWTNLMVLLLLGAAFALTFGLTVIWTPTSLPERRILKELSDVKKEIQELKNKIDELKKILEE